MIRIIRAQQQAIFRAGRKHAVGLCDALCDQIINHHADIGLATVKDERLAGLRGEGSICPGHEALRGGFLITRRAVDLASEE